MISYAVGAFSFHDEFPMTWLPRLTLLIILALALVGSPARASDSGRVPTIDDLLTFRSIGSVAISPDGRWVAYTVSQTDFKADAFIHHIWIADPASGRNYQLTRGEKSASNMAWSPDSRWLAFTSDRVGDKNQIFAIPPDGGEAVQLTKVETGVNNFEWSPDGKTYRLHGLTIQEGGDEEPQGAPGRLRGRTQGIRLPPSLDD